MVSHLLFGARILIFLISFYGYLRLVLRVTTLRLEFVPAFVFTCEGLVVFFAGLLNIMLQVTWGIYLLGILLAIYSVYQRESIRDVVSVGMIIFGVISLVYLIIMRNLSFEHFDNFSHWGLVAREILLHNRFPNSEDTLIVFQSYQTGSAACIYFVCKLLGRREGLMMFAQLILIVSYSISLYGLVKKKKNQLSTYVITSIFILLILGSAPSVFDLLVDKLIAVMGVCAIAIVYDNRDNTRKMVCYATPIFMYLVAVKNSGLFFALVISIYIIWLTYQNQKEHRIQELGISSLSFVLSILVSVFWNIHTKLTFTSVGNSKHSISLENYKNILGEKSIDQLFDILKSFCTTSLLSKSLWVIVLWCLVIVVLHTILKIDIKHKNLIVFSVISYITFQLFTLAMYIFSMPEAEAKVLAGFSRYHRTILIFVLGIIILYTLLYVEESHKRKMSQILMIFTGISVVLMMAVQHIKPSNLISNDPEEGAKRDRIERVIKKSSVKPGKTYMIYDQSDIVGYDYYFARYYLESTEVLYFTGDDITTLQNHWKECDYLIIMKKQKDVQKFLKKTFPKKEIGSYPIVIKP